MSELEIKNLNELLNFDNSKKEYILDKLLETHSDKYYNNINNIEVSKEVYIDTNIEKWGYDLPELIGSKKLLIKILNNPINDIELLKKK